MSGTKKGGRMKHIASLSTIAAVVTVLGLTTTTSIHGFSITSPLSGIVGSSSKSPLFFDRASSGENERQATTLLATASASDGDEKSAETPFQQPKKTYKELRAEGGPFTVNTPIGALNPFALYYFCVSVSLGIPWVIFCKIWQFVHWISGGRFDPKRRLPITISHCWGMALMRLTRCYPKIHNREIVDDYFKKNKGDGPKNAMLAIIAAGLTFLFWELLWMEELQDHFEEGIGDCTNLGNCPLCGWAHHGR